MELRIQGVTLPACIVKHKFVVDSCSRRLSVFTLDFFGVSWTKHRMLTLKVAYFRQCRLFMLITYVVMERNYLMRYTLNMYICDLTQEHCRTHAPFLIHTYIISKYWRRGKVTIPQFLLRRQWCPKLWNHFKVRNNVAGQGFLDTGIIVLTPWAYKDI